MWWCYLLAFVGGSLLGCILMGLMAASHEVDPHEVHAYVGEDGDIKIMTFPPGDKIIWHKPEDAGV